MVNTGQLTRFRRAAKTIATAATAITTASLALTAGPASAAVNGTVSGINSLTSVTCPTARACVAVGLGTDGTTGKSAVINATTSKTKAWSGGLANDPLNAVACAASATSCLTVADDAVATVAVATGAMKVTATPKPPAGGIMALGAVACASAKACYAVGFQGTEAASKAVAFHLSAAGKVVHKATGTGRGVGAIACPAATRCLISDNESAGLEIQLLNSGKFGASSPLPANTYVQHISCYKASLCYALGGSTTSTGTDELFPVNPTTGAPGSVITLAGFSGTGMTCLSATTCLVVGFTGSGATAKPAVVPVTSGSPGTPVHYPGVGLDSIACAGTTTCYAVGLGSTSAIVDKVAP